MKLSERIYDELLDLVRETTKLGNGTTYLDDLKTVGKEMLGSKFLGVFTSDMYPNLRAGEMIIVNLDKSNEAGSHWIAIAKKNNDSIFYDSFGRSSKKIFGKGKFINTEPDAEQRKNENNCGQRTLAWLLLLNLFGRKFALEI
jgi:hypothetical protein